MFNLGAGGFAIPSVVWLREDGSVTTGEAAVRRSHESPGRAAYHFKRRIGDAAPLVLGGSPLAAHLLYGRLLSWVVGEIAEREGGPPVLTAVTHPANWGEYKKEHLAQAIAAADIGETMTLTEPEAAAIHYAAQERVPVGSLIAVYDLGGGTFDAAVLRKTDHGFEIVGEPHGIEQLGGIDFDEAVFTHVQEHVAAAFDSIDPNDAEVVGAVQRLRQECERAKITLSSETEVDVPVVLPGTQTRVRITREEFEAAIRPAVAETVAALERATRGAGLDAADLSRVLLVGGSSRIPLVAQMVTERLGRPVAVDADPKNAIALGAAHAAAERAGVGAAGGSPSDESKQSEPPADQAAPPTPAAVAAAPAREEETERRRRGFWLLLGGAALVGAVIFGFLFLTGGEARADSVVLETISFRGTDPFTESVVPDTPELLPPQGEPSGLALADIELPADQDVVRISGTAPGLYGGSQLLDVCDVEQLISFLRENPDKGAAWAGVHGISTVEIESFIRSLAPVVLQVDTRVTNHGFAGGTATAIDSILQAGTAVLVDAHGIPRAKCNCGNPLLPPRAYADDVELLGAPWEGFDLDATVVIEPAGSPVTSLSVKDLDGDGLLTLAVGGAGTEPPTTTVPGTTSTTNPTTTDPTTTTPPPPPPLPDQLAFVRTDADGFSAIFRVGLAGEEQSTLVRLTPDEPAVSTSPTWSPDGQSIAFASDRGGSSAIWRMDAGDGGNLEQLTSGDTFDRQPAWSPDGGSIAYASATPDSTIRVLDLATGQSDIVVTAADVQALLTEPVGFLAVLSPAWSPDGTEIAFVVNAFEYPHSHIFIVDVTDGSLRLLTDGNVDLDPAWSPSGSQIVFSRSLDGAFLFNMRLFVMDADGSDVLPLDVPISLPDGASIGQPAWSSNNQLAFVANPFQDDDIFLTSFDFINEDPLAVTVDPSTESEPAFPPVGTGFGG